MAFGHSSLPVACKSQLVQIKQYYPHTSTPVLKGAQLLFAGTTANLQLHGMDIVCCSMSRTKLFLMSRCLHVVPCFTEHMKMSKVIACIH